MFLQCLMAPAHLIHYGDNIDNLRTQVQNLRDAIKSVVDGIHEAECRGATRDPDVGTLLEEMDSLIEEASKIINDEERGLSLCACYRASKSAKKKIDEAVELLEKVPPGFETFESRASVSNEIMGALKDTNVNKVGVYGISGTGKTTLAAKIGAELQLNGTFSYVVLATVSEKQNKYQPDLTNIQKQIAGGLKIHLQGETLNDRATQLREQLQKKDKVLIILDDIWSALKLQDMGIPVGSSAHKKFKILMTSRSKMVLESQMDSRNIFGLDSLPFVDARNLFDKIVGGYSQYSNWRPTAEQGVRVVRLCGGIPIFLATTGRALRNANRSTWEDALTQLKQLHGKTFEEQMATKLAEKTINEFVELLEQERNFNRAVANVDFSQSLGVTPFPDFEEFESRASVSYQIVAALKDPNVNKVGVYGMGGTGKTTLAEKIGAELKLNGTFSYVVLAIVSEKQNQPDLTSIQEQIAGGLKMQLQGETLNDRATQLRELLQRKDKVLIILDDIWYGFQLQDVGIPVGSSVHTKFKILMTSRSKMVLETQMDSRNNFGLDSLPFDDAWKLFDRMVGGESEYSNWRPTAEQVVEHCGGIPILLATTGRALRNANRSIWKDTLNQLKQFHGEDFFEDAYKRIEVSYKFLKSEEIKKLFLLCAQLDHRSIPEEDLLKYAMGLDLFKERKKLKEVRGRLHKYLRDLKGCCLLQDGNEEGIIKMHDVVHKFASFVAFRDHHMFSVAADGELEEWPSKDKLEHFSAISLPYCHLPPDHMLPAAFDNPKLESFLMFRSDIDASFKIPDNFFAGMKGLKLMDLTRMSLSPALVSSLSALVKLRTLCLDGCELGDIAVIGELPMVQALSLIGSSIVWVPKEIGKLGSTLKLLDLRDCWKLETIASGVISRLTLLEDLRIGKSFTRWEQLQRRSSNNISADETYEAEMASLEEFKNLRNLINLEIHIPEHAKMFPKDLVFKKLETFRIFIGSRHWCSDDFILPRTLVVAESSTAVEFDNEGTKALMTIAESLSLEGVKSSVSVSEMDPKGFPELKHLGVRSGDGIQFIVKKNYNNCIFPKLETLHLDYLPKLERICDDHDHQLPVGSFENLRVIAVDFCNLLNDLLSSNLARGLLHLKEIRVKGCESMESIIVSRESENEEEIKIGFTDELRALTLCELPRLASFYNSKQLEGVPISFPTPIFNKKIVFPKLEELELSWLEIEKIWDDHLAIAAEGDCWFQNLTSLKVYGCKILSYLFTFSMVKNFAQLKNLNIRDCKSIEEIVATSKGEMEGERLLLFPKLECLVFVDLPKLKFFCHSYLLEFQSLQKLEIEGCPRLNPFMDTNDSTPDLGASSILSFD